MEMTTEKLLVQILRDGIGRRAEAPASDRKQIGAKERRVFGKNLGYLRRRVMNKQIFFWEFYDGMTVRVFGTVFVDEPRHPSHPLIQQLLSENMVTMLPVSDKFPSGGVALTLQGHEYAKKLLTLEKL